VQHKCSTHWCLIPTTLALTRLWRHSSTTLCRNQGWVQDFWDLKLIQFLWFSLMKVIQNYKYKIRHGTECLLTKWKEIATNYKFKIADSYHKCNKIPNDSIEYSLNNFITHFCYTSFLHSLSACRLMASLYDNGFVTSFPVDRIKTSSFKHVA